MKKKFKTLTNGSAEPTLKKLKDSTFNEQLFKPIKTETLLDELFSLKHGIMPATITLLIGDPGIGKSTVAIKHMLDVKKNNPGMDVLFISSEMTEIDLVPYAERLHELNDLDIMFLGDYIGSRPDHMLENVLSQGWDLVLIDSFEDVLDKCRDEAGVTKNQLSNWLIELLVKQTKGENKDDKNTAFVCIQHVTKSGNYVGSSKLKHATTAMMEIRWDYDILDGRYIEFSKNRRGEVNKKLYFTFDDTGVEYNEEKFRRDQEVKKKIKDDQKRLEDESSEWDKAFTIQVPENKNESDQI